MEMEFILTLNSLSHLPSLWRFITVIKDTGKPSCITTETLNKHAPKKVT